MVRSLTERLAEKTVERQFLHELEMDFELAPATRSAGVLGLLPSQPYSSGPREGLPGVTGGRTTGGRTDRIRSGTERATSPVRQAG